MRIITIIASALLLQSCASTMPMPTGKMRPVNSVEQIEAMEYRNQRVIVPDAKPAVKEILLREFNRPADPTSFIVLDGSRLIDRVIRIKFDFGSQTVEPTGQQLIDMMELGAAADRIRIRAQNSARDGNPIDAKMARLRAEEVKYYLVNSRGIPDNLISISYEPFGGYLPDNELDRDSPRRVVEVEYIFDRLES